MFTFYLTFITCCISFLILFLWVLLNGCLQRRSLQIIAKFDEHNTLGSFWRFFLMSLSWVCLYSIFVIRMYYIFLGYTTTLCSLWYSREIFNAVMRRSHCGNLQRNHFVASNHGDISPWSNSYSKHFYLHLFKSWLATDNIKWNEKYWPFFGNPTPAVKNPSCIPDFMTKLLTLKLDTRVRPAELQLHWQCFSKLSFRLRFRIF